MTVGYAAFQTNLNIKGTSKISSNWDIRITNVTSGNKTGNAENAKTPTWTNLTASMEANLYEKGDAMEYEVTVENKGTFDAKLEDIITNIKSNNEAIKITFSGYTKGEKLYKNTTKIVNVKIEYNKDFTGTPPSTSSEVEITLDYGQAEGGTIEPTNDYLVIYDCKTNGGEDCSKYNEYLSEGTKIDLSYTATKSGWTFAGWNTNKDATTGLTSLEMKNADVTLYAIYKKEGKILTASFNNNGGVGTIENITCKIPTVYNNTEQPKTCNITLPNNTFTKEEMDFIGWNTNSKAKEGLNINQSISEDTEYYAIWKDTTKPIIDDVSTSSTTNSITIVVKAHDDQSGISKYEYSINGGTYVKDGLSHQFTGLSADTNYDINIKVTNGDGLIETTYSSKTINEYVTDGLYALYDGEYNTSQGHNSSTINTWYNKANDLNPGGSAIPTAATMNNFTTTNWGNDNGLEFDGTDDYVDTGFNQDTLGQNITISVTATIKDFSKYRGLWGYHDGWGNSEKWWGISAQSCVNIDGFCFLSYTSDRNSDMIAASTPPTIEVPKDQILNKKMNYTFIMESGKSITLYINGKLYDSLKINGNIVPRTDYNFIIGQSLPSPDRFFKGTIYNFKIYKKALSASEVQQNYKVDKTRYNISTNSFPAFTSKISSPTFTVNGKNVTINYPSGCGSKYTCSYSKDGGNFITITSNPTINFTDSGNVIAKVSDGLNEVASTYSFYLTIDNYVTDNLYAFYDGIENTKVGHNDAATSWYNKALDLNSNTATTAVNTINGYTVPTWTKDNGLEFDGIDDYIDSGFNQNQFGNNISISTVVTIKDLSQYRGIWGYHMGAPVWSGTTAQANIDILSLAYYTENGSAAGVALPSSDILNKKVSVTAVMKDKVGLSVYLNGKLYGHQAETNSFNPITGYNFIIGKSFPDDDRYFKGTIYNFMVYKKALTDSEVLENYKVNKTRYNLP